MLEKIPESVGQALINQRAGMGQVLYNQLHRLRKVERFDLRSSAFTFNAELPRRFTADGSGISPPLQWDAVRGEVHSFALIVEDADSPTPHPLVHAIVVGLNPTAASIDEGALSSPDHPGVGLLTGLNSFLQRAWLPPDPPRGHGMHRYVFQVFALGRGPSIDEAPGRSAFIDLVLERALAVGCLIGTYERNERVASGGLATPDTATPPSDAMLGPDVVLG